jgi:hypothetical protein
MADAQPAIEENIQESSKCIDGEWAIYKKNKKMKWEKNYQKKQIRAGYYLTIIECLLSRCATTWPPCQLPLSAFWMSALCQYFMLFNLNNIPI